MKRLLALLPIFALTVVLHADEAGDRSRHERATEMLRRISAYQQTDPDTSPQRTLKIVYVCPKDMEPKARYVERITGWIDDFNTFFRHEFKRNGFGEREISVERNPNGSPRIHLVKTQHVADSYTYNSGRMVDEDIRTAIPKELVDDTQSVLMIVCALSRNEPDSTIRIFSPFYGRWWNHYRGASYMVDHELLDMKNFADTTTILKVNEHRRSNMSLAQFNITYIGGALHELGHGLSLPHNCSMPGEVRNGAALMGNGNYHYRGDRAGHKLATYLSFNEAARLVALPLFSGSPKEFQRSPKVELADFKVVADSQSMTLSGKINSDLMPYAVCIYADPAKRPSDYDALNWTIVPAEDGSFSTTVPMTQLIDDNWKLKVVGCFVNGAYNNMVYKEFKGATEIISKK